MSHGQKTLFLKPKKGFTLKSMLFTKGGVPLSPKCLVSLALKTVVPGRVGSDNKL